MISDPMFALPPSIAALKQSLLSAAARPVELYFRRGVFYTFSAYGHWGTLILETEVRRFSVSPQPLDSYAFVTHVVERLNLNVVEYLGRGRVRSSSKPVPFERSSNGRLIVPKLSKEEFNRTIRKLWAGAR